jgi:RNA polymerase sigma-70 factor, ECF subfamily
VKAAPVTAAPIAVARDDDQLMKQIESGNADAFEELYARYYSRAYRVAWSVCRDDGRSEEAVQDSFVSIWRSPGTYRPERGTVAGWLLCVVRYRAIDVARGDARHATRRAHSDTIGSRATPGDMSDEVAAGDDADRLAGLLRLLPDAQQEVIALAFYGQLTHAEIATQLGLPPGTVKGRMRLGLQKLRVDIDQLAASERWHIALAAAFYDGDLDQARRIVQEAGNEMPVVSMLDDVLAPAMHNIGALWQANEITIADEHLATTICHRLLAEISTALQVAPAKTRETVVLVTPAPEQHTSGLLMASDVLYGAGYNTVMLGGGIPPAALSAALLRHQPALVALSSTMAFPDALAATATMVHSTLPAVQLVVGGATARKLPANIPAHYVERLDGLLATVSGILNPRGPVSRRAGARE